ncbi:putative RNA polymerase II subunit B1 CTD phosphatase RPAP2, partial [Manduca sexta]
METATKTTKKKPSKIEEMTKEQIRQAILKKRECNARAQYIVESLLEKGITEQYLLQCLPEINQTHFDDVVEERSIIHLCGYPICSRSISEKDIPKQKYRISVKTNKVYDITARKNYCSNSCYKSAMHVKKQLLTSPLWFREYEVIPTFHLLPLDSAGSMGQEIDVSLIERIKPVKKSFTSINDFTSASFKEITGSMDTEICNSNEGENGSEVPTKDIMDGITQLKITEDKVIDCPSEDSKRNDNNKMLNTNSNNNDNVSKDPPGTPICIEGKSDIEIAKQMKLNTTKSNLNIPKKENKKQVANPLNIVGEIIEKPEQKIDPILTSVPEVPDKDKSQNKSKKKTPMKKQPVVTTLTIEVEKCVAEWFTIDTLLFLLGEEKVKELVADKGECIKEYLNNYAKGVFYNSNAYDQYQALCKKLNMLELEDKKYDAQTLHREMKPLPDYSIIQEESKKIQLKVKAFYAGQTEIPTPEIVEKIEPTEEDNITQLPLVDKNAQNALRRRIVCQHLNKMLPDLLRSLGLLSLSISSDIRLLVNTFMLKANNIMFKPIQWTLIAIIFIKLLSLRDKRLEVLLAQ